MIIHNIKQNTPEWLAVRLGKFTASQAQAIASAGKGLETLVFKKVAEILTDKAEEGYKNFDMERGHELEAMARGAYELESGNIVKEVGFCELDKQIGCSPDGLVGDRGLVEIKCPSNKVFVEYLYSGKIDTGYMWQMQMQMYVTDRAWCDYAVFNDNFLNLIVINRIIRDESAIEKIKAGLATAKAMSDSILLKIKKEK